MMFFGWLLAALGLDALAYKMGWRPKDRRSNRRFWFGVLLGLSAGSALHHASRGGFTQQGIGRIYHVWAKVYDLADLYMFGQLKPLRRRAMDQLGLQPGDSVLEVSCGTGANFAELERRIGPTGQLVGIDYTLAMLTEAERQVAQEGWENVELVQADAATLDLGEQFDAVLWMLAASVVPDWRAALKRAVAHVKPGGRLVIADARYTDRWYVTPFNWYADIMGLGAAADIGRRPWELLPRYLENVGYDDLLLGFLYAAWGEKATEPVLIRREARDGSVVRTYRSSSVEPG
jgi:ubiquinone/menaquinone biosynthesis C-methylase UbiE